MCELEHTRCGEMKCPEEQIAETLVTRIFHLSVGEDRKTESIKTSIHILRETTASSKPASPLICCIRLQNLPHDDGEATRF